MLHSLTNEPSSPIGIYACESQPVVSEGLTKVFAATSDLVLLGASPDPVEALAAILRLDPQVVLVDATSGLREAFATLSQLREQAPEAAPVLWVQELAEIESFRALQLGARGILRRRLPVAMLLDCLRAAAQGSVWIENEVSNQVAGFLQRRSLARLTPREREIIQQIIRGAKNKDVAAALGITPGTVKVHLMHIFEKTGVKDRLELAIQGPRLLGLSSADLITGPLISRFSESNLVSA